LIQAIYFSHRIKLPESLLTVNGQNIPFVNDVKYLGVIFDEKIAWGLHIKTSETKAFRAFVGTYSLFKSEHLSANIKLTLYKALIRSIKTYASPAWEFAANTHLLKLQRLQNKVLLTIGNFPRRTPVQELHKAFNIPYITIILQNYAGNKQKLYKIMKMQIYAILGKAKPNTENIRGLNLAVVKRTTVQAAR
jgi:hypothetical protein